MERHLHHIVEGDVIQRLLLDPISAALVLCDGCPPFHHHIFIICPSHMCSVASETETSRLLQRMQERASRVE